MFSLPPNQSVTSHIRSEISGVNPIFGSLELLQDCLRTAMESESRSAPERGLDYLICGDSCRLLLIYQTHSAVASSFRFFFAWLRCRFAAHFRVSATCSEYQSPWYRASPFPGTFCGKATMGELPSKPFCFSTAYRYRSTGSRWRFPQDFHWYERSC